MYIHTVLVSQHSNTVYPCNRCCHLATLEWREKVRQFDLNYEPYTAAYGQHGHIVIREMDNRKLHVHDFEGREIRTVTTKFDVWDITSFKDKFYATESSTENGRVFVYNSQLELMNTIKVGYKSFGYVAVTDQFMFVTSYNENKVYREEIASGGRQQVFTTRGLTGPGRVGSNGRKVAVCCRTDHKVYVFDTEGTLLHKYGGLGAGPGQLSYPWGVAMDHTDTLFICDLINKRVCIVSPHCWHMEDINMGNLNPESVVVMSLGQLMITCDRGFTKSGIVMFYRY